MPNAGERRRFAGRGLGIAAGVILLAGILQGTQVLHYRKSADWRAWFRLNREKGKFIDYRWLRYNEKNKDIFAQVGWTGTDYHMILSWQYIDPLRFSPERFCYVASRLEPEFPLGNLRAMKKTCARLTAELNGSFFYARAVFILAFIFFLAAIRVERRSGIFLLLVASSLIAVYFYFYFILNRSVFRVLLPIWLCVLWTALLVFLHPPSPSGTDEALEARGTAKRPALVGLGLLLLLPGWCDAYAMRQRVVVSRGLQADFEHCVDTWKKRLPDNAILYSTGGALVYRHHFPLRTVETLRALRQQVIVGCWINQTPHQKKILESRGLDENFFAALAEKDNVFWVNREPCRFTRIDRAYFQTLQQFMKEKYGIVLIPDRKENIPYLTRMKFAVP